MQLEGVNGTVAAGWEPLAVAFASVTRDPLRRGAALHVRVDGAAVCDLWTGERRDGVAWAADTPLVVFSVSKGLVAMLVARLVERGLIDLDERVAAYWSEFGAAGKGGVTFRQVMSHQAGLPFVRRRLHRDELVDATRMSGVLAAEEPLFPPGRTYLYHALTVGWIIGEVVHRVTGQSIGDAFQTIIAEPLGVVAWLGAPADVVPAIAQLYVDEDYPAPLVLESTRYPELAALSATGLTLGGAIPARFADPGAGFNDPVIQRASIPGAGVIASARAIATIYSAAVNEGEGFAPLDDEILRDMTRPQSEGPPALAVPSPWPRWGTGFMLDSEARPLLSANSFGHDGVGGQLAFGDLEARLGFGFVSNGLRLTNDCRATELVRVVRSIVGTGS